MAVNPINIAIPAIPEAHHRGAEELPWAKFADGIKFQLLQIDIEAVSYTHLRAHET